MLTVRRLLALGVVATTAAYVGIVAPNATATTVGFPGGFVNKGRIELTSTANSLTVAWYEAGSNVLVEPAITVTRSSKCLIDTTKLTALAALLEIRPTAGGVTKDLGYVSNGLGTRANNTCNTANGTLDDGEAMELTLGANLRNSGVLIDQARLDLEGKFGTSLGYTTFSDDADTGTYASRSDLWSGSDNGSDSGPSDNRDVLIGLADDPSDDFVKLSITPVSANNDGRGQIGLEAGGDWGVDAPAHYTTLWLVQQTPDYEYALNCGETQSEEAGTDTDFAETTFPALADLASYPISATIARYDNDVAPTGQACAPIGANLSSSDFNVLLRKTTVDQNNVEQDPRLRFELVWAVPADLVGSSPDPFERFVDLDGIDGPVTGDIFPVEPAQYCSSYTPNPALNPDGDNLDGFVDVDHAGSAVHPADLRFANDLLSWCMIGDVRTPGTLLVDIDGVATPIDVIFQRVIWDGQGDPKFF